MARTLGARDRRYPGKAHLPISTCLCVRIALLDEGQASKEQIVEAIAERFGDRAPTLAYSSGRISQLRTAGLVARGDWGYVLTDEGLEKTMRDLDDLALAVREL